ncbi:MAG: sigma-70 family RNA polymerase sigma factor, partial [Pirellulaceae bacterium]|nr:sigma-70 family RNA polymerase sigma factor [Pirellulaceae bacterium]
MNDGPGSSVSSGGLSLAQRLRDGSSSAWPEFVRLYGPLLDHWCRSANVPPDAIADVAQDIFVSAFRGLGRFDPTGPDATFRGWLWTVARSRIMDYHRRQKRSTAGVGGSTAYGNLQSLADPI